MEPFILTASGKRIDLLHPEPDMFCVEDIATSLDRLCRFTGHCRRFYSVAEHSWRGASFLDGELGREFLLHDAHEAYVGDLSTPLKQQCDAYRWISEKIDAAIRVRFGLPETMSPQCKQMDLQMLATEKRDLMPEDPIPWPSLKGIDAFPIDLKHDQKSPWGDFIRSRLEESQLWYVPPCDLESSLPQTSFCKESV
ncbi:MAG: hypothetical protein AAF539_06155 [Planctomycetota bacterium]